MQISDCYLFDMYLDSNDDLLSYQKLKEVLENNTNYELSIPTTRTPLFVGFPTFVEKYDEKMFADFSELREFAKLEACDSARQLEQKFELAKKYFDNKEWSKLTFLIERPYRFEFFYWLAIEMEVEVPSTFL